MKQTSIENRLTENQNIQTVIERDLIIRDAIEIKEQLLNLLRDHRNAEIHFKNIERIDVAGLQLLVALSKSASKEGVFVKYIFEETEYITNVLSTSGFNEFFSIQ